MSLLTGKIKNLSINSVAFYLTEKPVNINLSVKAMVKDFKLLVQGHRIKTTAGIFAVKDTFVVVKIMQMMEQHQKFLKKYIFEHMMMADKVKKEFDVKTKEKSQTFSFDSILKLDNKSVQLVIKKLNQKTLLAALSGATEDIQDAFINNMSSNQSKDLIKDLNDGIIKDEKLISESKDQIASLITDMKSENLLTLKARG
jgi:flagellar motor switch protein FliG